MVCRLQAITVVCVCLSAAPSLAAEAAYTAEFIKCKDNASTTIDTDECLSKETALWDGRLNARYKSLMGSLNHGAAARLKRSEVGWIGRRDRKCEREAAQYKGGTFAGVTYGFCILDETIERTLMLERYPKK